MKRELTLRTVARVHDRAMRQVVLAGKPLQVYVFIDTSGTAEHSIVWPNTQDLLGQPRIRHFDTLCDLATALRDEFQPPF